MGETLVRLFPLATLTSGLHLGELPLSLALLLRGTTASRVECPSIRNKNSGISRVLSGSRDGPVIATTMP